LSYRKLNMGSPILPMWDKPERQHWPLGSPSSVPRPGARYKEASARSQSCSSPFAWFSPSHGGLPRKEKITEMSAQCPVRLFFKHGICSGVCLKTQVCVFRSSPGRAALGSNLTASKCHAAWLRLGQTAKLPWSACNHKASLYNEAGVIVKLALSSILICCELSGRRAVSWSRSGRVYEGTC
jgi:hypothetical protein